MPALPLILSRAGREGHRDGPHDRNHHPRIEGCAGRLSLNRPKAIHALDLDMVLAMTASLHRMAARAAGRGGADRPCRRPRLLRRRRRRHASRESTQGDGRGGARLLLQRISAEPPPLHLSQADHRVHGRGDDGRRRRHLAAVPLPDRDRPHPASPCPRPRSACSPTSAAAGICRGCSGGCRSSSR